MSLTKLEQTVLARFIESEASQLKTTDRYYPHGELVIILEDRVQRSVRKDGVRGSSVFKNVARHFVDAVIEQGAFSTSKNEFGGSMHKLDLKVYHRVLAEMQKADPILSNVSDNPTEYWVKAFEAAKA